MINIISRSLIADTTSGPSKVVRNLIKGLDAIGYPYVVNQRLDACKRVWIHDDTEALKDIAQLPQDIKVIIGPNLFLRPRYIPAGLDISRAIHLFPSSWAQSFWTDFGFNSCAVDVWPAGINTKEYTPTNDKKDTILLYFKQRLPEELSKVEAVLKAENRSYEIISYGTYSENEYKKILSRSKYIIWLGRHETQGIALEEALSQNIPMIVCEIDHLGQWSPSLKESTFFTEEENKYKKAVVAPYFDDRCGIKINNLDMLSGAIKNMDHAFPTFFPRAYILENLSLEKQARDLVSLYDKHFGLSYEDGLREQVLKQGKWKNATLKYQLYFKLKKMAKKILRKH